MKGLRGRWSKMAVCSNLLVLAVSLQPFIGNYCYIYWHHAPALPDVMRMDDSGL